MGIAQTMLQHARLIRRRSRQVRQREDGQTAVVSVLFLVVILGFAGIVVDGGYYMLERRDMQGVADAAALAGARELPFGTALAATSARNYVENQNSHELAEVTDITFMNNNDRIRVRVEREAEGVFMGFFGVTAPTIRATATAEMAQVGAMQGMLPFAIMEDTFVPCVAAPCLPVDFNVGNQSTQGNRGFVSPREAPDCTHQPGNSDYIRDLIIRAPTGRDACAMALDSELTVATGIRPVPVTQGFDTRIGPGGANNERFADVFEFDVTVGRWVAKNPDSPRIGWIPITRDLSGGTSWPSGTSASLRIVGYTMVYIGQAGVGSEAAYSGNGNHTQFWMVPLQTVLPHELDATLRSQVDLTADAPILFRLVD